MVYRCSTRDDEQSIRLTLNQPLVRSVFHDLVDTGVKHLLNFISLKSNGKLKFHSGSVNSMKKNFVLVYVVYQQFNKP